jgi:NADPH:quinone reductase-like Zn-dependent oxidoreductase
MRKTNTLPSQPKSVGIIFMRAMCYRTYGGPLEPVELETPTPKAGQILIRARHCSVNPVDWKMASGKYRLIMPVKLPAVPTYDVSGEVSALGPDVTSFQVGDRVHARVAGGTGSASAEYVIAGIDVATKVPANMPLDVAAALPLAGMTALQGLRNEARLPMKGATEKVLIVGASGGVGHLGVQIARSTGATVTGVCSSKNAAMVLELGAHEVIDYSKPDAFRDKGPWDVILDCVGGPPSAWTDKLVPDGRFVSCLPGGSVFARAMLNPFTSRRVRAVMLKSNAADLAVLDALFDKKALRVIIDSRFPLSKMNDAWTRSQSGRSAGKIVVDIDE